MVEAPVDSFRIWNWIEADCSQQEKQENYKTSQFIYAHCTNGIVQNQGVVPDATLLHHWY
jgi:hypothetical protein